MSWLSFRRSGRSDHFDRPGRSRRWLQLLVPGIIALAAAAHADEYTPADLGQHPAGSGPRILPDQFLRGYDPITVYYSHDVAQERGPADTGSRALKIAPDWPGAWFWADKRTLQFRPAEPWPALARFSVDADGAHRILTTMMSAPSAMAPTPDSTDLTPFRTLTLTFPQALPIEAIKQMIKLEIRDLPGLADSPGHTIKNWTMTELPRSSIHDEATYALTLRDDVPEGKQLRVDVSLALGDTGRTLWSGRVATRLPFHLETVQCGASSFSVAGGGSVPKDTALSCGNHDEVPQLVFSAPLQNLSLSTLAKLVRFEPAVANLDVQVYGSRVELKGRFVPDTLYKMHVSSAPVQDAAGRDLKNPGDLDVYFYRGWKQPFLRWGGATAMLEANGPRMLPLAGYGDPRADVRVYRVDPTFTGLWPFPSSPVVVQEQTAPPFPGAEPELAPQASPETPGDLVSHIRLLGSPLVSKVIDLPLAQKSTSTHFGLDLGPLLDQAVGSRRPGTYLVGLRRLTGKPERTYMRVQVTNLTLTAVTAPGSVAFYVRSLDHAEPVRGARIRIEGDYRWLEGDKYRTKPEATELTTDGEGKATQPHLENWTAIRRVTVTSGEDVLVLDPAEPTPLFSNNHWSGSFGLSGLIETVPPPVNDKTLGFLFTERPVYKPTETVYLKGWIRKKVAGKLLSPGAASDYALKIDGPGGQSWSLPVNFTPLGGVQGEFNEKNAPTGEYTATLFAGNPAKSIATRTFKIEAYRIPTFELQLSSATKARLDGPIKVKAVARYYAGGNVASAPISWTVTRHPYHYVPKGRPGFLFASSTQFSREGTAHPQGTITKTGTLDESGAFEMSVNPALDVDGTPRIYHFEATVTGADEQQVSAVQDVKALPPFILGLKLDRYMEHATEISPQIIAVGVDDKLLAGQDVTLRFYHRIWHSNLRETHFATGEAKYDTQQEDVKISEQQLKTGTEAVTKKLPIPESGVYVVELVSRDKLGRVQTLSADLYVGGRGAIAWQKSREGVFELSTDKTSYRPGEKARVVIESPFQAGKALVVVEEPEGNSYTWHDVSDGKAIHELTIRSEHVPNVPVHVILMRGRIGDGTTEDGRYKPQTLASSLDVEVQPAKNSLEVGLKFPDTARPGTTVNVGLSLADDNGKPLAGEVTLWLVDEAVLSLDKEATLDPLTAFIVKNARTTGVWDTRNLIVGRLVEQDEDPGGDGSDEEGGEHKRVVRKDFRSVPYYEATLQVPASGKLVVPVKLSDDLTNFRVRAVAASGMSRFGLKQDTLHVRLPVLVQPQLPRFVREGDMFWGGGVARLLEGTEAPGSVDIDLSGAVDGAAKPRDISLKTNKAESVVFPLTARSINTGSGGSISIKVGVTRKSDGQGDAFEVKLTVLPDRQVEKYAYVTHLAEGSTPLKPLPEPAREGTVSERFLATGLPGVLDLATSLEYLIAYPHGCLEQRLSQVEPELRQGQLLHVLDLDEGYGPSAMRGVHKVIEDLPAHQDEQGLFSYWPGQPGDIQLTAQVLEFIVDARKAGLTVDDTVDSRARAALQRVLRSDYTGFYDGYRWNQQVTAIRALAKAGLTDDHYLLEIYNNREHLDAYSLAQLALAMSGEPDRFKDNLDVLARELWNSVNFKLVNGKSIVESVSTRRSYWNGYYLGSYSSSLASVFEALLVLEPDDKRQSQLRDALLAQASAENAWGSTYDNRLAVEALAKYFEKARDPLPTVNLEVGGQKLQLDTKHRVAQATFATDEKRSVTVHGGEIGARIAYTYLPSTPGTQVAPLKEGFIVSRSATPVHADGTMDNATGDHQGDTRRVAQGDILELHTSLVNDEEKYFVALVVPFAAGFEPLNPELKTSNALAKPAESDSEEPTYVQRTDSEVRYYFNHLPAGTHTFHFRVRATTEGSFVQPAPWAEQMYKESVRGRGEGMRVIVTGPHQQ